ncbi:MAG: hypothetical protein U0804_14065 [Gemmataceae bacterium]
MEQLYSTGQLAVPTSPGPGGHLAALGDRPTFKAASRGLRAEDVQSALAHTGYALSAAWAAETNGPPPVRLALLQTPSAGRMLAHVAPNNGAYFAHALLHVPATADAQLAIRTWGAHAGSATTRTQPASCPTCRTFPSPTSSTTAPSGPGSTTPPTARRSSSC